MQQNYSKYFDEEGHLNTIGRTLYADAMQLEKVEKLPDSLQQHVNDCSFCSSLIVVLYDAIAELNYSDLPSHPLLNVSPKGNFTLSDNPQDIERILEKLMAEAVEIPSMERLLKNQIAYRKLGRIEIKVNKPTPNALCFNQLDFELEEALTESADLSIRNHKGRVFRALLPKGEKAYSVSLQPKENYPNGLYYWKLTPANGKPLVGKFYVFQR